MVTRRGSLCMLVTLCAVALVPVGAASAATVSNTNDSGPGSLRQAIIDAAPGETITVPAGTYTLTTGEIAIAKSLTIAGAGAGSTTVRGGTSRIFSIIGGGNTVTISGLTLRDCLRSGEVVQGGVIDSAEANLALNGVVITGNVVNVTQPAKAAGVIQGGLLRAVVGNLSILDSRIVGNTLEARGASGQKGGVIQGGGILYIPSGGHALTIERTSISENVIDARGGQGPAAAGQEGGTIQGGLLDIISASSDVVMIRSSAVAGNSADASGGPGGAGGTIQGGASLLIGGTLSLVEDTIAANSSRTGATGVARGGGAMMIPGVGGGYSVLSSTIAANAAEGGATSGGGNLYLTKGVNFSNSVVANGVGPSGSENCFAVAGEGPVSNGFNLDSLDQCGFHSPGDIVNRDPLLGPLQDNGGPTPTMLPAASSPLVDQGAAFGLGADQRGIVRPIDFPSIPNSAAPNADGSDIGAVELQPSNAFGFGKLKKNRKKGTARLKVNLPVPNVGTLTLFGKGLKKRTVAVSGTTSSVTFLVATKGGVKKKLRKRGKRKVAIKVTYAPLANTPLTKTKKTKLVRKPKKHKRAKR